MSFSALSLDSQLVNTLAKLGYQQPTPIQIEAIPAILAKQDVMAGAQTERENRSLCSPHFAAIAP